LSTQISIAVDVTWTACRKPSMSNSPEGRRKRIRFKDARLHAESSRYMYSEHGFDALIRPLFGDVCHVLIVVSYCIPGSPQTHAASAISRSRLRAR
jgi:hypothetical protein